MTHVKLDHRVDLAAERVHLLVRRCGRREHLDGDRGAVPHALPHDAERAAPDLGAKLELVDVDQPKLLLCGPDALDVLRERVGLLVELKLCGPDASFQPSLLLL